MQLKQFCQWMARVHATQNEELDCEQLFEMLPQYVEMELDGERANQHFPDVQQHLGQCEECYDLYLTVRDAVLLEQQQTSSYSTLQARGLTYADGL